MLLYRLAKIILCFVKYSDFQLTLTTHFLVQCSILLCQFLLDLKDFNLWFGNDLVLSLRNFNLLFLVRNSAFAQANLSLLFEELDAVILWCFGLRRSCHSFVARFQTGNGQFGSVMLPNFTALKI